MAADLTFGTVPPFYREMYDILCPNQENAVDQEMFIKLLVKSSLPKQTLTQIWNMADARQGYLSRTGLYKALAFVAFAQQGKQINEKLLQNFSSDELPKPSLGDLSDLRALSIRLRREKNPTRLGLTYHDICSLDTVGVTVVPEKKGLFLKHVEYEVSSERNKSTVQRRYNDFVSLFELLLQKYPYRMIPQLPPKKVIGADSQFIEERRRSLRRFLNFLVRHPVLSEDKILQFFLTFSGNDVQNRMKDHFRGVLDEFHSNELAEEAEGLLPIDSVNQLSSVREQMKQIFCGVVQLRDSAERIVERIKDDAADTILFGKELSSLAGSSSSGSDWGTGGSELWVHLKKGMKNLYPVFSLVSGALLDIASEQDEGIVEELNLFLDLLSSFKVIILNLLQLLTHRMVIRDQCVNQCDLCDRYENFAAVQRQRTASRGNRKMTASQISVDAENQAFQIQEKRHYFFLHCIHMETQLVHTYMEVLVKILQSVVKMQSQGHSKISSLWDQALPLVETLVPDIGANSPTSTIQR